MKKWTLPAPFVVSAKHLWQGYDATEVAGRISGRRARDERRDASEAVANIYWAAGVFDDGDGARI